MLSFDSRRMEWDNTVQMTTTWDMKSTINNAFIAVTVASRNVPVKQALLCFLQSEIKHILPFQNHLDIMQINFGVQHCWCRVCLSLLPPKWPHSVIHPSLMQRCTLVCRGMVYLVEKGLMRCIWFSYVKTSPVTAFCVNNHSLLSFLCVQQKKICRYLPQKICLPSVAMGGQILSVSVPLSVFRI